MSEHVSDRRVLITGSRKWADKDALHRALFMHMKFGDTLVSGACPTGADKMAEDYWRAFGPVERHPADWDAHGKAAGPKRNQQMVDLGADLCIAFPLPDSRGTTHCMAAAEKAGIRVIVVDAA